MYLTHTHVALSLETVSETRIARVTKHSSCYAIHQARYPREPRSTPAVAAARVTAVSSTASVVPGRIPSLRECLRRVQRDAAAAVHFEQLNLLRRVVQLKRGDDGVLDVKNVCTEHVHTLEGGTTRQLDEQEDRRPMSSWRHWHLRGRQGQREG